MVGNVTGSLACGTTVPKIISTSAGPNCSPGRKTHKMAETWVRQFVNICPGATATTIVSICTFATARIISSVVIFNNGLS